MSYNKTRELELWKDYQSGQNQGALPELLVSMDPLIQNQVNRFSNSNLPRPALEAEARRLATGAFQTYNPNKSQLNTHVTNHLKHLQRYVLSYQNVGKIPEHRGIMINKFQTTKNDLSEELGREPTASELADRLSWSVSEVRRMENELRKDLSDGGDDEESYFDEGFVKSDRIRDLIEFYYYAPQTSKKEKLILEYSFGLGGKPKLPVSEIARRANLKESEIRKIRGKIAQEINKTFGIYY